MKKSSFGRAEGRYRVAVNRQLEMQVRDQVARIQALV
jgi:hypothetical protein